MWVATGSQVMYGINTATQQATQYILPRFGVTSTSAGSSWEGAQVFSLADGTVLLIFSPQTGDGVQYGAIWNPATGSFTQPANPAAWGAVARSGDGAHVLSFGEDEDGTSFTYDATTQTFSKAVALLSFAYAAQAEANGDGTRVAVSSGGGFALFDGDLNPIGLLPGDGGGFAFSPDGQTIYEETGAIAPMPVIAKISVETQQVTSMAPAMLEEGWFLGASIPWPFAIDSAGMVLGIQNFGIAFDDPTATVSPSSEQPGTPPDMGHMEPFVGPLTGGTVSGAFGDAFSITPDIYYGAAKAQVTLQSNGVSITSPAATTPGPVDVKMLFPDGNEVYNPLFFTYGAKLMDTIVFGSGPQGGAASELDAFGLPFEQPGTNTVTIGGSSATITSTPPQYPPFTGELTAEFLNFNVPAGTPGWADVTLTTPNGSSTLPKSFFYASSVNDYATSDSPTFVLYDKARNQLYLSAGNHIDVFSLATMSFTTALQPPAVGKSKQFEGLALTPDGKYLLATNLSDFSLAVIDPDSPSNAYAVPVATGGMVVLSCTTGPLFVAADNLGNAYVVTGGVISSGCGTGGYEAMVNLTAKTSTLMTRHGCDTFGLAGYVGSTADGTLVAFASGEGNGTFQMYVPSQGGCFPAAAPGETDELSVAADGNVIGLMRAFVNSSGNIVGRSAYPAVFCPNASGTGYEPGQDGALENPRLNDAGSLDYWAYPNYVNIVDVRHGTPALRFGLTETVTNTVAPLAIDSSGQRIFLITNKGLTIVDLGNAPLSIGHFSQASAGPGTQLEVRGSGFEEGISATLGGQAVSLAFTDSETLTLTVPAASAGPQDLVLTNPDGTTYTLQNAINVQ